MECKQLEKADITLDRYLIWSLSSASKIVKIGFFKKNRINQEREEVRNKYYTTKNTMCMRKEEIDTHRMESNAIAIR
jgi:hypothetical protein